MPQDPRSVDPREPQKVEEARSLEARTLTPEQREVEAHGKYTARLGTNVLSASKGIVS